jgi:hypothetical protein
VFLAAGPDAFVVIGLDDRGQDTGFAPGVRARVGLLPAWTRDEEDGRRRGFAMAVDVRVHFFGEVVMMSPALMLGYETY